ncbi:MAG: hypothetical protein ACMUIL_13845 [bacterium]
MFICTIRGKTSAGQNITVTIRPDPEDQPSEQISEGTQWEEMVPITAYTSAVTDSSEGSFQVTIYMDIAMLDAHWHNIEVDVPVAVRNAVDGCEGIPEKDGWYMTKAGDISLDGDRFRIDHICFEKKRLPETLTAGLSNPNLFELGLLNARILEHHRYLFMADYEVPEGSIKITDLMFDPENFLLVQDPDNPNDPVVRYWTDLGADPNRFGKEPDPTISSIMGREFVVDLNLPIFTDPDLCLTTTGPGPSAKAIIDSGTLNWYVEAGGYPHQYEGHSGSGAVSFRNLPASMSLHCLPVYPYDGMPTYLPAYNDAMGLLKAIGKPFFTPDLVFRLESALWNAGVTVWPNIVAMDYTPEYFEDLFFVMGVTDGIHWDTIKFSVSVVNYPMENYPPVVQLPEEDQVFGIGRVNECIVDFIDPDCFIFSLSSESSEPSEPRKAHAPGFPISMSYRTDMEELTWNITFNSLPEDKYGPWVEQIIQPDSGLITWAPDFECALDTIITCTDARDAIGFGQFTIFCRHLPVVHYSDGMVPYYPFTILYSLQPSGIQTRNSYLLAPPLFSLYGPQGGFSSGTPARANRFGTGLIWPLTTHYPGLLNTLSPNRAFLDTGFGFSGGLDSSGISKSVPWGMVMPWWAF